jgi:hypothetical protein
MATAITAARAALDQAATGTTIPFDYSFRFRLEGSPERRVQQIVRVSSEGAFIAVSIGYGFKPLVEQKRIPLVPASAGTTFLLRIGGTTITRRPLPLLAPRPLSSITLEDMLRSVLEAAAGSAAAGSRERLNAALRTGIRINPEIAERLLLGPSTLPISSDELSRLFELAGTPGDVQFLYALTDEGSGREFQSEPILSTAGLGSADGDRPFRQFPMPIRFEPNSSIRMDITEIEREVGDLHVVLHGYKLLSTTTPASGPAVRAGLRRRRR